MINGIFTVTVFSTTQFDIIRDFVATESGARINRVRQISVFALVTPDLTPSITSMRDNGLVGMTVFSSGVDAEFLDGRRITLTGTGVPVYDGLEFRISEIVPGVSFDIIAPIVLGVTTGTITMTRTDVVVERHDLETGESILIDKSINYDDGCIADNISTDLIRVDLPFLGDDGQGIILNGSLTGTAKNVLVDNVSGEINSKAKGSFSMFTATPATTTTSPTFANIALVAVDVNETNDTELWRLTDDPSGEMTYTGIEPFSGELTAQLFATKSGGGGSVDYTFRAVRNGGTMVDNIIIPFATGTDTTSTTFVVPIFAVTGNRFRLQVAQASSTGLEIEAITVVIQ